MDLGRPNGLVGMQDNICVVGGNCRNGLWIFYKYPLERRIYYLTQLRYQVPPRTYTTDSSQDEDSYSVPALCESTEVDKTAERAAYMHPNVTIHSRIHLTVPGLLSVQ